MTVHLFSYLLVSVILLMLYNWGVEKATAKGELTDDLKEMSLIAERRPIIFYGLFILIAPILAVASVLYAVLDCFFDGIEKK